MMFSGLTPLGQKKIYYLDPIPTEVDYSLILVVVGISLLILLVTLVFVRKVIPTIDPNRVLRDNGDP